MNPDAWATEKAGGVELKFLLQPRAVQSQIMGIHGGEIKVRIQAPPIDGRANQELCRFLSKSLRIPQRAVQIVSGASSRHKRVFIKGKTLNDLQRLLSSPFREENSD